MLFGHIRSFFESACDRVKHGVQQDSGSPDFWTDSHVLLGAWESGVRTPTPTPTPTAATPRTPRAKNPREGKSAFFPAPADGAPDKTEISFLELISRVFFVDKLVRGCWSKTMRVRAGNRRGTGG